MRCPQILVHENDGRLAGLLRELTGTQGWSLHEVRRPGAGLALLHRGGPSVLVLRAGRDVEQEMALVEMVAWRFPHTRTLVVCDADNRMIAGLAWDLGASCVLSPGQIEDRLPDVVSGLMRSLIDR